MEILLDVIMSLTWKNFIFIWPGGACRVENGAGGVPWECGADACGGSQRGRTDCIGRCGRPGHPVRDGCAVILL